MLLVLVLVLVVLVVVVVVVCFDILLHLVRCLIIVLDF